MTSLTTKLGRLRCLCTSGLSIHVYLATIKDSYCSNSKYIEANSKAIHALKSTLNNDYLCRVANIDSAFVVWNIILSLDEKEQYYAGSDSDVGSDASNVCYMVQGDNPLDVTTESEVEEDVDMSYDEFTSFCQQLLEKYDMIKKDNKNLKKKFDCMLKENDSFKNKVACIEKENEILKNENVSLLSKLNDLCEGNTTCLLYTSPSPRDS